MGVQRGCGRTSMAAQILVLECANVSVRGRRAGQGMAVQGATQQELVAHGPCLML